jgi:hypothetical protein
MPGLEEHVQHVSVTPDRIARREHQLALWQQTVGPRSILSATLARTQPAPPAFERFNKEDEPSARSLSTAASVGQFPCRSSLYFLSLTASPEELQ